MSPMLSRRTLIAALAASPALAALPALAADDKVSLLELAVPGPIPSSISSRAATVPARPSPPLQ